MRQGYIKHGEVPRKFWPEGEDMSGVIGWMLFDQEGDLVGVFEYRSAPFFFAAEHEIKVVMVH